MKSPLSVVLICQGDAADTEPYVNSLKRAFLGMDSRDLNAAPDYEWLHPLDFRAFSCSSKIRGDAEKLKVLAPNVVTKAVANSSERMLVVVLLGRAKDTEVPKLVSEWLHLGEKVGHVSVLFVSLSSEKVPKMAGGVMAGKFEALGLKDLDERDLRQDLLTLHAMQMALRLLNGTKKTGSPKTKVDGTRHPTIFFSHAKKDGVPLAKSVKSWLKSLKRFRSFYDTDDLDLTGDISKQLKSAVAGSIVVALRTEVYDSRYWCQKEVYWAEIYDRPLVTVDARWSVQHGPAVIGLDGSPSVRIPDGSVTRILMAAMKEGLRIGLLHARVNLAAGPSSQSAKWAVMSRYPTLASLHGALGRLNKAKGRGPGFLVYPNPALPDDIEQIAKGVAAKMLSGVVLCSLDEFRIYCGGGGTGNNRPFVNKKIGITCSADDAEMASLGLGKEAINHFVIDLSRRVIAMGGSVVLGHKWHNGGIMDALGKFALAYKSVNATPKKPIIVNYLAHPNAPELSELESRELEKYIKVDLTEWRANHKASHLPQGWDPHSTAVSKRAKDLFANRERLVMACDARVVIGGRSSGSSGSASGVLEETWLALKHKRAVLCSTALHGMAKKIVVESAGGPKSSKEDGNGNHKYLKEMASLVGKAKASQLFVQTDELAVGALIKELNDLLVSRG